MSLFTAEEICTDCIYAIFHECCHKFCRCMGYDDRDYIRGKCPNKIKQIVENR